MGSMEDARDAQLANIEARTGKTVAELVELLRGSGLEKHGQMVKMLKTELGMGHGDANLVAHTARAEASSDKPSDPADDWYSGAKAAQRPIHDQLLAYVASLGSDIEHSPKKTYLSLRRSRQFATIGPAARSTVEIGVNLKGEPGDDCMQALGPGKMCTHRARISSLDEIDDALHAWIRRAYEAAG